MRRGVSKAAVNGGPTPAVCPAFIEREGVD